MFKGLEVTGLEVMELSDAMALPETAASCPPITCASSASGSCCVVSDVA